MIGDLGYRIPYGQACDLRSPTAHLSPEAIEKSRTSGSIALRLRQGFLVEVQAVVLLKPPDITLADPADISFPQRTKSHITPGGDGLAENVLSAAVDAEDEELLKQIADEEKAIEEGEAAGLPVSIDPAKASAILDKVSGGGCCGKKKKK